MLKDALKNYLDRFAQSWEKEYGELPKMDAEITEQPSACFVGEADDEGWIQWRYVEQPHPLDFDSIEKEYQIHICEDVKQLYNSYLFLDLEGFLDGYHIFIDAVTDETDDIPFPSDIPPTDQYPYLMIIGLYRDISLCVDIVTGKVYEWDMEEDWEGTYKDPELIADSLTDVLTRMTPTQSE